MMKNAKILSMAHCKKWYLLLCVLTFAEVKCGDAQTPPGTTTPTPSAGLLCISDCATCPVICSPPPSPVNSKPPPSHLSPSSSPLPRPPTPPVHYYSPSQPYFRAPPPSLFPLPLPPAASPPPPPTPPPPAYISWGNAAPPPPSIYYGGGGGNIPSIQVPPGMGQRNYSYPYYYFYASKAPPSFTFLGSSIFVLLLSILHVL